MSAADPQLTKRMAKLYEGGLSVYQVAVKVGRAPSTVGRHLERARVQMRPRGGSPPPGTAELVKRAVELYAARLGIRTVGEAVGWSYTTTRRRLREAGVKLRSPGRHHRADRAAGTR